jgi:hypothetical protein
MIRAPELSLEYSDFARLFGGQSNDFPQQIGRFVATKARLRSLSGKRSLQHAYHVSIFSKRTGEQNAIALVRSGIRPTPLEPTSQDLLKSLTASAETTKLR